MPSLVRRVGLLERAAVHDRRRALVPLANASAWWGRGSTAGQASSGTQHPADWSRAGVHEMHNVHNEIAKILAVTICGAKT